jgi:hypothetical protein
MWVAAEVLFRLKKYLCRPTVDLGIPKLQLDIPYQISGHWGIFQTMRGYLESGYPMRTLNTISTNQHLDRTGRFGGPITKL